MVGQNALNLGGVERAEQLASGRQGAIVRGENGDTLGHPICEGCVSAKS